MHHQSNVINSFSQDGCCLQRETFYVQHCIVYPFLIYSFGLPIWYLQTFYARFKTELVVI
jgi:hypothetical protein